LHLLALADAIPERKKKDIARSWQLAVGAFIRNVLKYKGDAIEDIMPDVTRPFLRDREKWKQLFAGDMNLSPTYYRSAIEEICELYCFKDGDSKKPASKKARALITQYQDVLLDYSAAHRPRTVDNGLPGTLRLSVGNSPLNS